MTVAIVRRAFQTEREGRIADLIEGLGLFCWVSILGSLASYAVAASSTGFQDIVLARADAALGFDWTSVYQLAATHRWMALIGSLAYRSIFVTPVVIIVALWSTNQTARVWHFTMVFSLALISTLILFHFFPARSALAFHIGTNPRYMPTTGIDHIAMISGLRSGIIKTVDATNLLGLITFPSFHAVSALLFTWAGWSVRRIRIPLVVTNGLMLIATPIEGTHYLVDVIAGLLLAGTLIAASQWKVMSVLRLSDGEMTSAPVMAS